MNSQEATDPLKTLRLEILRAHTRLVKKQQKKAEAEKIIFMPADKVVINDEDIVKHAQARKEANTAHEIWIAAQVRYFDFIKENKVSFW